MLRLGRLLPEDERTQSHSGDGYGRAPCQLSESFASTCDCVTARRVGDQSATDDDFQRWAYRLRCIGWPNLRFRITWPFSLHAANDALRDKLVPVNDKSGLSAILTAADEYFEASGRRLTFEYVLVGWNQRPA